MIYKIYNTYGWFNVRAPLLEDVCVCTKGMLFKRPGEIHEVMVVYNMNKERYYSNLYVSILQVCYWTGQGKNYNQWRPEFMVGYNMNREGYYKSNLCVSLL